MLVGSLVEVATGVTTFGTGMVVGNPVGVGD